jgi:DNA gyrase subunit A
MAVHFNERNVRSMGRNARGVKAMTLDAGDAIVAMDIVQDGRREVLLVTSLAFGKRTPIEDYRHTSRGGKGVKAFARQRDDVGKVVDQILVAPDDEVLMITSGNQVIRLKAGDIRKTGRDAKGVRLQRLGGGDEVIAITNLGKQSSQLIEITGEPQQPES